MKIKAIDGSKNVIEKADIDKAIALAGFHFPYMNLGLHSARFYENDAIDTAAVDGKFRIQINGSWFNSISVPQRAAVILHEVWHPTLGHFIRALLFPNVSREILNQAMDVEIHCCKKLWNLLRNGPEKFGICAEGLDLEPGRSMEYYVEELLKRQQDKEGDSGNDDSGTEAGDGSNGDSPSCGDGSSGTTDSGDADNGGENGDSANAGPPGVKPLTQKAPELDDDKYPGMGDYQKDQLVKRIIHQVSESADPGELGSSIAKYVGEAMQPPKVPWQSILKTYLSEGIEGFKRGNEDKTYARMGKWGGDFISGGTYSPEPNVSVILDTSGSMGNLFDTCLAEIGSLLQQQEKIFFMCFDTDTTLAKPVRNFKDLEIQGGGGTCMDQALIRATDKYFCKENDIHVPDIVVLLTDCETRWPKRRISATTIVVAVGNSSWLQYVPKWCNLVKVGG